MSRFSLIILWWSGAMLVSQGVASANSLDYRIFSTEANVYIVQPTGLLCYFRKSRTFQTVVLDESRTRDSIMDVHENDGLLWLLTPRGIYQFDMSTATVEKIPFLSETACDGKITADYDYVWLSCRDSLLQFDKLGREWLVYPVEHERTGKEFVSAAYSNGDEVFSAFPQGMRVFYVMDEKWKYFPLTRGSLSRETRYLFNQDDIFLIDGRHSYRYITDTKSWEIITADSEIQDAILDAKSFCYLTQKNAYRYLLSTSISKRFDIQNLANARSVAKISDSLYAAAGEKNIYLYNPETHSIEFLAYSEDITGGDVEKLVSLGNILLVFSSDKIALYDFGNKLWETTSRRKFSGSKKKFSWDNEGVALRYQRGYNSSLKGSAEQEGTLRKLERREYPPSLKMDDSETVMGYKILTPDLDLTLHNSFPRDRYLDLYFNNSHPSEPARKLLKFRGSSSDVLQDGLAGINTFEVSESQTLPEVQYEGGALVLESKKKLKKRDRKVLRVSAGGGLATSRTERMLIPYNPDGRYNLLAEGKKSACSGPGGQDTTKIVPGSLRIWIDGEEIDSTQYTFVSTTGAFNFSRKVVLEPSSIIKIQYQTETIPDGGIEEVELLPENHFGKIGYMDAVASYTDWLSTRVAYVPMHSNTDSSSHLAHAAIPVELRRKNIFLKLNPEFTYNGETGSKAGGLSLFCRLMNRTSLNFTGLLADGDFNTTDYLSTGYGNLENDFNYSLSYDILEDLTISYSQTNRSAVRGEEKRYEAALDGHLPRYPLFKIDVSRNIMDARPWVRNSILDTVMADTVSQDSIVLDTLYRDTLMLDTLNRKKDKVRFSLYETSSPFLEKTLRFNKIGYEFIWTEFLSDDIDTDASDPGRIFYGRTVLSPLNALTFTSQTIYQKNPPGAVFHRKFNSEFRLQTIEAPPGLDLSGQYEIDFNSYAQLDSSLLQLRQSYNMIVKPGVWLSALSWFSPRGGISYFTTTPFSNHYPGNGTVLFGNGNPGTASRINDAGVHIMPKEDIFFENNNTWNRDKLGTFNDLKLWFNSKRALWQTRVDFNTDYSHEYHFKMYSRFDNIWVPWFNSTQGIFSTYDETAVATEFKIGPGGTAGLNIREKGLIKRIINDHTLNIDWYQENNSWISPIPGIFYEFRLRIEVKPNLSFDLSNSLTLKPDSSAVTWHLEALSGRLKLQAFF